MDRAGARYCVQMAGGRLDRYRYWRQGQTGGRLTGVLITGTLPGVIAGSVIRVEWLPGLADRGCPGGRRRSAADRPGNPAWSVSW